ncbi:MAG: type II secretion system F family protein, partial [Candidatus Aenigmarchaeota archaeon]|nr:type II secretion system F family protein [Candidatus Aenigmarchaeota archaeon]
TLAVRIFGGYADRGIRHFEPLRPKMKKANMRMLLRVWVSIILMSTVLAFFAGLAAAIALQLVFAFEASTFIYLVLLAPVLLPCIVFMAFYYYPIQKAGRIGKSIDNNLPFALAHMNAIVSSGIPPEFMFELLANFKEYGELSNQAALIVRNIKTFGMSSVAAIEDASQRAPSESFKHVLDGIHTTISEGGDLVEFLRQMSDKALFDYRLKREKYLQTLSTYADIYTALLIAAPLILLAVLGIIGIIGGDIGGIGVRDMLLLMTFVFIPVVNIAFIAFLESTYPGG